MEDNKLLFIYSKEGNIKILNLDEVEYYKVFLFNEGWEHISTIDPSVALKYLYAIEHKDQCWESLHEILTNNKLKNI